MKNIILCEGKTDAILLSYYLGEVVGWTFDKKLSKGISLPIRNMENEDVNVYEKDGNQLIIWAVGGQANFDYAISQIIRANRISEKENAYKKLIVLTDRDQMEDHLFLEKLKDIFTSNHISINITSNNSWVNCIYQNEFKEENHMKLLPIIIPFHSEGALETFLLDAICEMGEEEKQIVEKSKDFILNFKLLNYLNTQRLKIKGELAVTLGSMFPEKIFTPIDAMLKDINWEEYKTIQEGFRKLEEI